MTSDIHEEGAIAELPYSGRRAQMFPLIATRDSVLQAFKYRRRMILTAGCHRFWKATSDEMEQVAEYALLFGISKDSQCILSVSSTTSERADEVPKMMQDGASLRLRIGLGDLAQGFLAVFDRLVAPAGVAARSGAN